MKAFIYGGPGKKALENRAKPELRASDDAIVRITKTTICGTDLHILKGDVPTCAPGRILGHEGVGVVEQHGGRASAPSSRATASSSPASPRAASAIIAARGMYSHCDTGGWILGNTIDGTQAEFVRIPHADTSLYRIPAGADEEALVMLSDILPTGFECGVLNGKVAARHGTVAIVGAGPHRTCRAADRPILFAGPAHLDRSRREPAGDRQAIRRHGHRQQPRWQRRRERSWR